MFAIGARKANRLIYLSPDEGQVDILANIPLVNISNIVMPDNPRWFSPPLYGVETFGDLFTNRQALALETFASLVRETHSEILRDALTAGLPDDGTSLEDGGTGARAYADAITTVLGLCVGKMAQSNNILVRWFIDPRNGSGKAMPAFDRHAVPMVWDFVETNPFGGSVGDWTGPVLETALRAFDLCVSDAFPAEVHQQDARTAASSLPKNSLVATDPPYYANIGYADLSDFFYLWIRVALKPILPKLLATLATPKESELIATPCRHGGSIERANTYFRNGFAVVFGAFSETASPQFPMLIVYAIKQGQETDDTLGSTGWEVFLGGLVDAGLSVVATWPVRTTTDTRSIGLGTNALASAIFVVCRPRAANAPAVTLRNFLTTLKADLPQALKTLQASNIAPVDLAQASIGPGMAVYTRYAKVLDAKGNALSVHEALTMINQTLDELLTEQEADLDPESRWAVAWFEQKGFDEGEYGTAETLSKAKNTAISGLIHADIVKTKAGKLRLVRPGELSQHWDSKLASSITAWGAVHRLVGAL